jgi:hypothetical protein
MKMGNRQSYATGHDLMRQGLLVNILKFEEISIFIIPGPVKHVFHRRTHRRFSSPCLCPTPALHTMRVPRRHQNALPPHSTLLRVFARVAMQRDVQHLLHREVTFWRDEGCLAAFHHVRARRDLPSTGANASVRVSQHLPVH